MLKKLVSFTLALVMIMGCLSVTAFAESNVIDEIEPNDTDDTMQLIEPNVTVKGTLPAPNWESEDAMIDFDAYKFVLNERSKVVLTVTSSSKMVIPAMVNVDKPDEEGYAPEIDEDLEELPDEYVIDVYLEKGTYCIVMFDMFAEDDVTYEFTLTAKNAVQTLKEEDGVLKYYVGGEFAEETTLVKYNGKWFYIEDGIWQSEKTTLVKYNGSWYYVKKGNIDWTATTVCKYKGTWYYVKNGKIDWDATTLCKYNGKWYYIKNGKIDWNARTLVKYNGTWYYVKDGKKNTDTTLVKYNGTWYYVKNGKKNTATTLCKYNGKYYYVKNGKKNADTAIVKYNSKKYYVKKGIAQTQFTGKAKICGKTYTVKKGVIK